MGLLSFSSDLDIETFRLRMLGSVVEQCSKFKDMAANTYYGLA